MTKRPLMAIALGIAGVLHGGAMNADAQSEVLADGLVFRGPGAWELSDDDYLQRAIPVLPTVGELGVLYFPEVDIKGTGESIEFGELVVESPLYFRRASESLSYGLRFNYEYTWLDTDAAGLDSRLDLHRFELAGSTNWQPGGPGSPWRVLTRLSGILATDGSASVSDAAGVTFLTGAFRRVSPSLTLGAGAYYDYVFGEHRLIPGAGFVWVPTERFAAGLVGPRLQASYQINDDWRLRAEGRWRGPQWAVGETAIGGSDTQVEMTSARVLAALERRLYGGDRINAWFSLQGGYRFLGELELRDSDRNRFYRQDLENGFFFGAALRFEL